jgi:hypothetical protein
MERVVQGRTVLLLDLAFKPLKIITRKKARLLLYRKKAWEILPGEILQLSKFVLTKYIRLNYTKRSIFLRDNWTCQYCGEKLHPSKATVDHIHPKTVGGKNSFDNCVTACQKCNIKKGGLQLQQTNLKLKQKPFVPNICNLIEHQAPELWSKFQNIIQM